MSQEIRKQCIAKGLNRSLGKSCTDEELCTECWIERDIERHPELYKALEG